MTPRRPTNVSPTTGAGVIAKSPSSTRRSPVTTNSPATFSVAVPFTSATGVVLVTVTFCTSTSSASYTAAFAPPGAMSAGATTTGAGIGTVVEPGVTTNVGPVSSVWPK